MIGGIDVIIPTTAGKMALEAAVRVIRFIWPHAVFANSVTAECYDQFEQIPFGLLNELFVYRDVAARELWEVDCSDATKNTMLHLLIDDTQLAVVVDDHDATTDKVISTIQSALQDSLFRIG